MKRLLILAILLPVFIAGIRSTQAQGTAQVVQLKPGMTVQSLSNYPATQMVQLRNNKQMTVGELRRWDLAAQKIRAAKAAPAPRPVFELRPTSSGIPVSNRNDLLNAIKTRPTSDTVQLPSGKRVTVAQLRALEPFFEQRVGRTFDEMRQPGSGQQVAITRNTTDKAFWKDLLSKPGNERTVLESPSGKQVTVGDLKQYLTQKTRTKSGALTTLQPAPTRTVGTHSGGVK